MTVSFDSLRAGVAMASLVTGQRDLVRAKGERSDTEDNSLHTFPGEEASVPVQAEENHNHLERTPLIGGNPVDCNFSLRESEKRLRQFCAFLFLDHEMSYSKIGKSLALRGSS